jgi:dolichol-phosphate mannosyltransferase
MKRNQEISVIIPTYNEAGNIVQLVTQILKVVRTHDLQIEIIIVDDNSPDKTGVLALNKFKGEKRVKVYIRKKNRGLATAILYGIKKSSGDYILGMDADFNHNPKDIPRLVSRLKRNDLVVGSRFIEGGGMDDKLRYHFTYVFNLFLKKILHFPTTDNLSGFSIIERDKLYKLPLDFIYRGFGEYHLRLVYIAKINGLRISEVPVFYHKRFSGKSKSNLIILFFWYLYCSAETLLKKPNTITRS